MPFTHETESAFVGSQYKKETDWGVIPSGDPIKFSAIEVIPTIKQKQEPKIFKGFLAPNIITHSQEWSEWEADGDLTHENMALFVNDVITDGPGNPISYCLEHNGLTASGCTVTGWSLEGNTDSIKLKANLTGKAISTGTLGIGVISNVSLYSANNITIYLGGVLLNKVFKWSISVSQLWTPIYFIGSNQPSNMVQTAIKGGFRCNIPADSQGIDYINNTNVLSVLISNNTTTGGETCNMSISFDIKLEEPEKFNDSGGVYALGLKGNIMNKAEKCITVVNTKS